MRTRKNVSLVFAAIAALTVGLTASANAQAVHRGRLDTVYVGSVHLRQTYLHNDSSESIVVVPDSGASNGQRVVGRLSKIQRIVDDGAPALFRVSHFSSPTSDVTDSIMTDVAGLAPQWETSHQTSKLMHLRFSGRRVTGDVTPTGKATELVDHMMAVPPFNSSDLTILIGALPIDSGYSALLATYEYEVGGLRVDTLRVMGRDQLTFGGASRDAWVVRVSRGGSSWMTAWVDAESNRVVKEEYGSASRGWTLRLLPR